MMKTENYTTYFVILGLFAVVSMLQLAHYYPALPEIMAQKYNFDGEPFRYGSKNFAVGLTGALALLPIGILALVNKLPMKVNNVPNQEFWMREENKPKAKKIMMKSMFQLCLVMSAMLLMLSHFMLEQNITGETMSPYTLYAIIGFSAFVPIWMVSLFASFRNTQS